MCQQRRKSNARHWEKRVDEKIQSKSLALILVGVILMVVVSALCND
jgi:hypothetical protein